MPGDASVGRFPTRTVAIGPMAIGGGRPRLLQSMVNVSPGEKDRFLRAVDRLLAVDCRLIRLALANRRDLSNFLSLLRFLPRDGVAYVADLHFGSELALAALDVCEKVRINPGNFGIFRTRPWREYDNASFAKERELVAGQARTFFQKAAKMNRAVRIGCNGGSIAGRMRWRHGDSALLASMEEMVAWAREVGMENLVISLKASDCRRTVEWNRMAVRRMAEFGWDYPLHLGVTEAGCGVAGLVRGAIGIGTLVSAGMGDTLRLSLAEAPEREVEFCRTLLAFLDRYPFPPVEFGKKSVAIVDGCADLCIDPCASDRDMALLGIVHRILSAPQLRTVAIGRGRCEEWRREVVEWTLQCCGWGNFRTEIIACPTCGRTTYDVAAAADAVRVRLGNLPNVRIAVMGCVVNGVGEMGDADYGYIGCGKGRVNLYRKGICLLRSVPEKNAIDVLEEWIYSDGKVCGRL
ncbi:MAG: flavodoxin-dependent (E)-4-hydroxy-3-methylbut-2-enyl-diphosphate synthase [Puniceicoccales bacterium]|nr:flavodoxin-dependent (E)-4-hydroxy-3-methylbut-2-enyl-diphosphate synthase [Puniceicoccales bacterium]